MIHSPKDKCPKQLYNTQNLMTNFNKVKIFISCFIFFYTSNLFAQDKTTTKDSTKTLAEVLVLGSKKTDFAAGSRIISIDSKLILRLMFLCYL